MHALVDGDILRYEVGFAAETGWRKITENEDALPPFEYVEKMLLARIGRICGATGADEYTLFITEGETLRFKIATQKPYKATRVDKKPWHFNNLTIYMKHLLPTRVITGIEADDAMTMAALNEPYESIICSRDKDLRQVPSRFYSWEIGKQPSFGPKQIDWIGNLDLGYAGKARKLSGEGLAFFFAQVLIGDSVDNIPGLPYCGPVAAYDILNPIVESESPNKAEEMETAVAEAYQKYYGNSDDEWENRMIEQGRLCWMIRRFNEEGEPEIWRPGLYK